MSSAERVIRLMSRIVDERTRRKRQPRRGVATYFPEVGRIEQAIEEGSPGELVTVDVFPSAYARYGGLLVNEVIGAELTRDWTAENLEMGARLGKPQPRITESKINLGVVFNGF
jgi:hypothetical protein